MFEIYTDGSVQKNGKPDGYAGWAMVHMSPEKLFVRYGHFKPTSTNGRGEIGGVLYALALFYQNPNLQLKFISDAQYVIKSINEWRHKHVKYAFNGIKNRDLLEPLYTLWDAHGNSTIEWVKGHSGVRGNEIADEWADRGCRQVDWSKSSSTADIRFISDEEFRCTVEKSFQKVRSIP